MTDRENMELIFKHEQPDWIPHFRNSAYTILDQVVERPLFETGSDAWGYNWISCPTALNITHPDPKDIKFDDVNDWKEKADIPDLEKVDFTPMVEQAKGFANRDEKMINYISLNGIFERSHILMGFENALCAIMEDPDIFGDMMVAFADHKIKLIKKVYELIQPDILNYHDDMGTQASQFMDTELYKKYLFPQYKRIVDAARQTGYKYVVHHSCGHVENLIPDWLSCGFDGWNSVMPCNNLPKLKKEYGDKIVFLPGLDAQTILGNPDSTEDDIEKMVVKWMNMLAYDGKGLIIDSSVSYSLNPKNEELSAQFIKKHGKLFMDAVKAGKSYTV